LAKLHPDLDTALTETLASATDQTPEFKRRLRRLIENATTENLPDSDVQEVIELAFIDLDSDADEVINLVDLL
jgi:transcriptional/translational regulatory protein YebC/TACO1